MRQLRPGALDNLGLVETLKDLVSSHQAQYPKLNIQLYLSENLQSGNLQSLGETISINLYRIVQESLNNALKYAEASTIEVRLNKMSDGELQLSIKDNGIGMNIDTIDQSRHFGLLGMRERVQALHGTFAIISTPGLGTEITIKVPVSTVS